MAVKLAIIGRPNVGKSTLFNRLAGRRLALVDDRPGVTRDRREGPGQLGDLALSIIDTAGIDRTRGDSLEARMRAQALAAAALADVILFLFDAREGVTGLDEEVAEVLRREKAPVVLVANKCEGRKGDEGLMEAWSLGFGEPVALSAEHGEGMSDLYAAISSKLAPAQLGAKPSKKRAARRIFAAAAELRAKTAQPEGEGEGEGAGASAPAPQKPLAFAIIGRPNAGKSTLANALLGEERLITGPEAGITRDSISVDWNWRGQPIKLVDTAGLRRKARVAEKLEKLSVAESLRAIQYAEICVLTMDARDAFEKQDLQIADLVVEEGRALVFVLTKWDLVENPQALFAELKDKATRLLPQARGAVILALSAQTGIGLQKFMPALMKAHKDWNAKAKTGDLNRWLKYMIERHPPPAVDGKRIKPRYLTQIKSRPPTFVMMCSRASALPDSYKRYLVNGLREAFDMPGVPIRLIVRQNRNRFDPET